MSGLEIVAVIVSALAVWLTARRNIWCWPVGCVSVMFYSQIFFDAKLYSDLLLQLIFFVMQLYGWWHWTRNRTHSQTLPDASRDEDKVHIMPRRLSVAGCWVGLMIGAAGSLLLGYVMARFTDAHIPWLDSALTSFSLVAQYWMARKYIVNWWLWIAVDVIYIGVYVYKDLQLTAGLYAMFIILAIVGLRNWRRELLQYESATPSVSLAAQNY
ncbi:nicotinamide riboside transporter PnuC [Glaciimonas sp. CA11.2]|uniref:nicotinamide riboside transporter PnuC n=1 Tax=Glaciimonas sp. CA11.2 TaxID=3048601 RepID=UPI002AB522E5|nr:nicotinamide riboside transporter PnuC [Glaciimonas sp. CA11.2]MDY7547925.1 nicotinamide riboside transporter PnuC [Glaciimonas sp. CA11.2]MEB0164022.1 nicotinamide riboside transporter PnuC [Glaciimonas sp. CA11.2]